MAKKKSATKYRPIIKVSQAPGKFVDKFDFEPEFFKSVKLEFGLLREAQVEGFKHIIENWNKSNLPDVRWLAYMLATTWHETNQTMQPITEFGSTKYLRSKKYWPFIGRGYVQLTWKANYQKYGIANDPTKALDPDIAAHIMIDGMTNGIFTGRNLSQYFNEKKDDPVNARRIINGTDRAQMVAGYYWKFKNATKLLSVAVDINHA